MVKPALSNDVPAYEDLASYDVSRESFDRLLHYYALLQKWQKAINLVSPDSMPKAWARHFLDSIQLLPLLPQRPFSCVDLGSGGGFPGLVIAMCRPDVQVRLVDSDQRKCQFLRTVSRESGLTNVQVSCGRVEEILPQTPFDLVSARGFAALDVILSMVHAAAPDFNGVYLLMKGARFEEEIAAAHTCFAFESTLYESVTDSHARILSIKNVSKS